MENPPSPALKEVHLSFLESHYVPAEKISLAAYQWLNVPNMYYERAIRDKLAKREVFIPGVGEFKSPLKPNVRHPNRDFPYGDRIWDAMGVDYESHLKVRNKVLFAPRIPVIADYLPSGQRKYALDTTDLPGTLATADNKLSKVSVSIYYFPLGYAVTRIGIFLKTSQTFDPDDLVRFLRVPDRCLGVTVRKGRKILETGKLVTVAKRVLQRFVNELCAPPKKHSLFGKNNDVPEDVGVSVGTRYSLVDFVSLADSSKSMSPALDRETIFNIIKSSQIRTVDALPKPLEEENGFIICGDQRGFMWLSPNLEIPAWRQLYRRHVRNLAMLVLIQKAMSVNTASLSEVDWFDRTNRSLLRDLKEGFIPSFQFWPLSYLHCLHVQKVFLSDADFTTLYLYLKEQIDATGSIDGTTKLLEDRLGTVAAEGRASRDEDMQILSQIISVA